MKARNWRSNSGALGGAALGIFGPFAVSSLLVAPLIFVLEQSTWDDEATSCVGDDSSSVLFGTLVLAAMAVVALIPLVRAIRRRVVLSDGVLSCHLTWSAWHVPVAGIESVSESRDSEAIQIRLRDGGRVELPSELLSRPSGEMLVAALHAERARSAAPEGDPPHAYVASASGGPWCIVPIVLGTAMSVGLLYTMFGGIADEEIQLDERRTAVATADVVAVDLRDDAEETFASVILPVTETASIRADLWHPGRLPLAVEDRIPVEYDPGDLCNVSFVDRPVANRTVVDVALNGGAALWYAALAAFVVVVVIAGRRARRAKHGG